MQNCILNMNLYKYKTTLDMKKEKAQGQAKGDLSKQRLAER